MFFVAKVKRQLQMFFVAKVKRQLQMFFVEKVKRQLQKSPTSIGDWMNADLSYFSVGLQTLVPPAATLSAQKTLADRS
ncbi:hypothetical protein [Lysinibacillus xylanilyticus]|uniref:hypothetical protein n=1 Tax=Lysinibacillus xylanilyticus TaxID=582475 RepID=UPI003D032436